MPTAFQVKSFLLLACDHMIGFLTIVNFKHHVIALLQPIYYIFEVERRKISGDVL